MLSLNQKKYLIVFPISQFSDEELREQIRLQTGLPLTEVELDLMIEQARMEGHLQNHAITNVYSVPLYLQPHHWEWVETTLRSGQRIRVRDRVPTYYTGTEIVEAVWNTIVDIARGTGTDEDAARINALIRYIDLAVRHGALQRRVATYDGRRTAVYRTTSEDGYLWFYYLVVYLPRAASFIFVHTSVTTGVQQPQDGQNRSRNFESHLEVVMSLSCFNRIIDEKKKEIGDSDMGWEDAISLWAEDVMRAWILCADPSGEYFRLLFVPAGTVVFVRNNMPIYGAVADTHNDIRGLQVVPVSESTKGRVRAELYDKDYNRMPYEAEIITRIDWCVEYDTANKLAKALCDNTVDRTKGKGGPKKSKPTSGRRREYREREEIKPILFSERRRRAIEEAQRLIKEGSPRGDLLDGKVLTYLEDLEEMEKIKKDGKKEEKEEEVSEELLERQSREAMEYMKKLRRDAGEKEDESNEKGEGD